MRISSKAVYALRALFDITFHNLGRPTKVEAIAVREEVPPRFLEQIFQSLKAAGLVGSKRGPKGGYFLLRNPDAISVGDVVRAIEGPFELPCEMEPCDDPSSKDVTGSVWLTLAEQIEDVLDAVTLSDLSLKGEELGVARTTDADFNYVI